MVRRCSSIVFITVTLSKNNNDSSFNDILVTYLLLRDSKLYI